MDQSTAAAKLADARWHLSRYDALQATTASKAATVLSGNALVLAGLAVLVSRYFDGSSQMTTHARTVVAVGSAAALALILVSVVSSSLALLALRPWRKRFGRGLPGSVFYQHNDTLSLLTTFPAFAGRFKSLTVAEELESVILALWVRTVNFKRRNENLRFALVSLALSIVGLAVTAVALALGGTAR